MSKGFILFFFLSFHIISLAGEVTIEIEMEKPNIKKAVQQAIQKVSMEMMKKFIEPSKLKEQKKSIQQIISTFSNRYILYTKTLPAQKNENSFLIKVTVGFSEENLKKILLAEDLFYSGVFNQRILPMVFFDDRVNNVSYSWWSRKKHHLSPFSRQIITTFYDYIQKELMSYGFYLINTNIAQMVYFLPKKMKFNRMTKKNIFPPARFFQAPFVLTGLVVFRESNHPSFGNLKIELSIYHTTTGRQLAEIERFEKIPIPSSSSTKKYNNHSTGLLATSLPVFLKKNQHFSKGLGIQLKTIYSSGEISSQILKITIQGYLTYQQFQQLKNQIVSSLSSVHQLVEHIISSRSVTFHASTQKPVSVIAQQLKKQSFPGFSVTVSKVKKEEIVLSAVAK